MAIQARRAAQAHLLGVTRAADDPPTMPRLQIATDSLESSQRAVLLLLATILLSCAKSARRLGAYALDRFLRAGHSSIARSSSKRFDLPQGYLAG
jgi:hypothetical protein